MDGGRRNVLHVSSRDRHHRRKELPIHGSLRKEHRSSGREKISSGSIDRLDRISHPDPEERRSRVFSDHDRRISLPMKAKKFGTIFGEMQVSKEVRRPRHEEEKRRTVTNKVSDQPRKERHRSFFASPPAEPLSETMKRFLEEPSLVSFARSPDELDWIERDSVPDYSASQVGRNECEAATGAVDYMEPRSPERSRRQPAEEQASHRKLVESFEAQRRGSLTQSKPRQDPDSEKRRYRTTINVPDERLLREELAVKEQRLIRYVSRGTSPGLFSDDGIQVRSSRTTRTRSPSAIFNPVDVRKDTASPLTIDAGRSRQMEMPNLPFDEEFKALENPQNPLVPVNESHFPQDFMQSTFHQVSVGMGRPEYSHEALPSLPPSASQWNRPLGPYSYHMDLNQTLSNRELNTSLGPLRTYEAERRDHFLSEAQSFSRSFHSGHRGSMVGQSAPSFVSAYNSATGVGRSHIARVPGRIGDHCGKYGGMPAECGLADQSFAESHAKTENPSRSNSQLKIYPRRMF